MHTTMTTSPKKTTRHVRYVVQEPADEWPDRHGDGAGRGHEPVGREGARSAPKFVATSATTAGMISAAPRPSRTDQPTIRTGNDPASPVMNEPQP